MTPTAIPAATLVLLRDGADGPELFMVERARSIRFAGGAMVFPGGKADPADYDLAAALFPDLDPDDAAARVAAVRETFEEAGVLVARGPAMAEAARGDWRRRLLAGETDFASLLRDTGHVLAAGDLIPFAHWCPPGDIERTRYDTRFYLARMPEGQTALHDGSESVTSHWIRPADALARADAGQSDIIFPTRRNLERLAIHGAIDALVAAALETPVRLIAPWIETRGDTPHLCIPDGLGYPVTAEPMATVRRGYRD